MGEPLVFSSGFRPHGSPIPLVCQAFGASSGFGLTSDGGSPGVNLYRELLWH
jgi:hypothetical protein